MRFYLSKNGIFAAFYQMLFLSNETEGQILVSLYERRTL